MAQDADDTVPNEALLYTDDLTEADVIALTEFLDRRLEEMAGRHPEGSDEHAAAVGFSRLVAMDGLQLRDYVNAWRDVEHRHEYPVPENALRQEIHFGWIHLCQAVAGWSGHAEFNAARWRVLRWFCPQHQEFVEAATGDAWTCAEPDEPTTGTWRPAAHP
ncbi:hypothetical protein J7W19_04050 [Streptomyces mobaraensis NBRC 13819 = DSM 40847]|uniref:Uncharacterized protein n=1 Tax=Streptomyces mobaraensis (strain ATCC 29032 / DSM 40847 / JCM 4168 / NBRC 13819 / NCIMB 11159 / IPCR 16-22) TaxID=1223523 RepID=M3A234_STRM1|nr:hypothetical protein [Streptomyces mobaraensis]EME99158.1 hypothetical protein H340_17899 [Streptomyces mobaraensis NBRC 13819 = DSM 40847]QTT72716.1 hypothetical protein J7W19_04050 [Streptomyces mobaraensis NBRC 13819 = DSM 40847]